MRWSLDLASRSRRRRRADDIMGGSAVDVEDPSSSASSSGTEPCGGGISGVVAGKPIVLGLSVDGLATGVAKL